MLQLRNNNIFEKELGRMNIEESSSFDESDIENEIMTSSTDSDHDFCDFDCRKLNEMEAKDTNGDEIGQSKEYSDENSNVEMNATGDATTERAALEALPPSCDKSAGNRSQRTIARSYQWVMPLLVAAFLCFNLISSAIRPYEVIIERRQRPLYLRRIFSGWPFSSSREVHRTLYYNYYGGNNADDGGNNADDGGNNADDGGNNADDGGNGADDGKDGADDGRNGADDGVYYDDDARNSAYYNATDDAVNSTYYEEEGK